MSINSWRRRLPHATIRVKRQNHARDARNAPDTFNFLNASITRNGTRQTGEKNYKQDTFDKAICKITKYNPEKTDTIFWCHASEEDNYTNESGNYSSNAYHPNQGQVSSYVRSEDRTLQSYESIHKHQYPGQIGHQNSCWQARFCLMNHEDKPRLRHHSRYESRYCCDAYKSQQPFQSCFCCHSATFFPNQHFPYNVINSTPGRCDLDNNTICA